METVESTESESTESPIESPIESPAEAVPVRAWPKRSSPKGVETRERILTAAVQLMADHGYAATSISMVSKKARVQPGSLYWAFGSKKELFREALNWSFDIWIANLGIDWSPSNLTELRRNIELLGSAFVSEPDFLRLMILAVTEHRQGQSEILEAARKIRETGRTRFSDLVRSALPKDISPERATYVSVQAADLALHLIDGVFLSTHIEPELRDPTSRFRIIGGIIVREIVHLLSHETLSTEPS